MSSGLFGGGAREVMPVTVIVPAFNEEAGISRVLSGLNLGSADLPDIEVVVAANGCTDRTASVAREFGVTVIEMARLPRVAALNAAEAVATSGHRIYLDADAVVSPELIRSLVDAVSHAGIEAAVPRPHLVYGDSSWPVRAYYTISERLPVFRNRLFGRGVIALSEMPAAGSSRFPDITADDMFLDAIVGRGREDGDRRGRSRRVPRRTNQLVRRLARARAGNVEFWRFVRSAPAGYGAARGSCARTQFLVMVAHRRARRAAAHPRRGLLRVHRGARRVAAALARLHRAVRLGTGESRVGRGLGGPAHRSVKHHDEPPAGRTWPRTHTAHRISP